MKDREDKTIRIILKGCKRAFHRRFHQLGNEYSSGTFGPFSRSLLSASVKNARIQLTQKVENNTNKNSSVLFTY
jgi:hypothetical protein